MPTTPKAHLKNGVSAVFRAVNASKRPSKEANERLLKERGLSLADFVIRDATSADIPALAELHARTWAETYWNVKNPPTAQLREHQWREQFTQPDRDWFCLLVVSPAGELAGFAKGLPYSHANLPMYAGEINKIYLLSQYQRMGLGRKLFCEVASRFLDQNIHSMVLFGAAENPSGSFHEAMGGKRLLAENGEFHGGYGWGDIRALTDLCESSRVDAPQGSPAPSVSKWTLLFPCTYLVHIAEEYWAGERFFHWFSRVTGANMTQDSFLTLNAVFMAVMVLATCLAVGRRDHRIVLVLASIVFINALLHLFGSLLTASYSPGLASAMVLWLPLAVWAFYRGRAYVSARQKLGAIAVGILAHVLVSSLAWGIM